MANIAYIAMHQLNTLVENMRDTATEEFLRRWDEVMPRLDRHLHLYLKPINEHQIELSTILVEKDYQGHGLGTEALSHLTRLADEMGVSIVLYPEPNAGEGYFERLEQYYNRFGFVSLGSDSMIYEPVKRG